MSSGAPGADGEGGAHQWGEGTTARCGGVEAVVGVSTVGVSSTCKNRPSHHKYKSQKYPVFEDEKSKASDEKSVKRKIA